MSKLETYCLFHLVRWFFEGKLLQAHYLQPETTSYFQKPTQLTQNDIDIFEQQIWSRQTLINLKQKQLIKILIKDTQNRQVLLEWFGECMFANANRAQEWLKYTTSNEHASDGFFLNILVLFLDLSQPFCENVQLLLKIDSSYSAIETEKTKNFKSIHFVGFDKDTKFLKCDDENEPKYRTDVKNEYNFITECFYATHRLYQISFDILNQKLIKLNQELARIQGNLSTEGDRVLGTLMRTNLRFSKEFTMNFVKPSSSTRATLNIWRSKTHLKNIQSTI